MQVITNLKEREQYQVWRKRNKVRLSDVAKFCECSVPALSQWENGIINISDKLLASYNEFINQFDKNN
ncbi:MAG: helix-turn-helix domain-containing protein [Ruminiclostridium sp.]